MLRGEPYGLRSVGMCVDFYHRDRAMAAIFLSAVHKHEKELSKMPPAQRAEHEWQEWIDTQW